MNLLTDEIQKITSEAGGVWGISLYDLNQEKAWNINGDEPFYAASVMKIPIMIAVFAASHRGQINVSDTVPLKREDIVGGSGVLQHMTPGTELTIYDLITLMIIQSDNTATNMLIDLVGIAHIQKTLADIGLKKSKFFHKMMTVDVDREGQNIITANEMTYLLKQLATGNIISAHACEQMITILKKQQIRNSLPAKIPEQDGGYIGSLKQWEIAHKTGNVSKVRHDVGIFYVGKRTMIASVLSRGINDIQSPELIAEIGLLIYQYMKIEST